ncbi:MAG: sulfatase-like hydrolase/transferase [Planctomycetaceae bacterium]
MTSIRSHRHCLVIVFTLTLQLIGQADFSFASEPVRRPNILLICVDDLKPVLGCYGDKIAKTPNIDRLAGQGVLFESAYCNQAVCSPSRNALMTSLRPQTLGIYDLATNFRRSRPDAVTVAQHFQQHGYSTQALGKVFHVGHGNAEDEVSWTVPHWRPKASQYQLAESQDNKRTSNNGPRGTATESADVADEAYGDGQIAVEAAARIMAAAENKDQPFFIACGFLKPHLPFVAPKRYWDLYDPKTVPMPQVTDVPKNAPSYAPQFGGELRQYSDMPREGAISEEDTRRLIHGYYAATSYTDAQIGRVLDALDASGARSNTIVVLWGDHGWHLGDHGMWCKHTNYEQATRIPLIISSPGCAAGQKSRALIETVDVYPTLCELAGLPAQGGLDGLSAAATLKSVDSQHRESVIHVYPRGDRLGRAIRTNRFRMVEWKVPGADESDAEYELYDYEEDPLETVNIAGFNPEVLAKLQAILARQPEAVPQIRASAGAEKTKPGKSQDRAAMFRKRDKDNDGRLSREEFLAGQPDPEEAPKRFPRFDKDQDGSLNETEFVTSGQRSE